jgi:hypothetical protein
MSRVTSKIWTIPSCTVCFLVDNRKQSVSMNVSVILSRTRVDRTGLIGASSFTLGWNLEGDVHVGEAS